MLSFQSVCPTPMTHSEAFHFGCSDPHRLWHHPWTCHLLSCPIGFVGIGACGTPCPSVCEDLFRPNKYQCFLCGGNNQRRIDENPFARCRPKTHGRRFALGFHKWSWHSCAPKATLWFRCNRIFQRC